MLPENFNQQPDDKNPSVNIGNASNPAPQPEGNESLSDNQLLSEGAEKYLREVASIEDYPDARDDDEMDKTIRQDQ